MLPPLTAGTEAAHFCHPTPPPPTWRMDSRGDMATPLPFLVLNDFGKTPTLLPIATPISPPFSANAQQPPKKHVSAMVAHGQHLEAGEGRCTLSVPVRLPDNSVSHRLFWQLTVVESFPQLHAFTPSVDGIFCHRLLVGWPNCNGIHHTPLRRPSKPDPTSLQSPRF